MCIELKWLILVMVILFSQKKKTLLRNCARIVVAAAGQMERVTAVGPTVTICLTIEIVRRRCGLRLITPWITTSTPRRRRDVEQVEKTESFRREDVLLLLLLLLLLCLAGIACCFFFLFLVIIVVVLGGRFLIWFCFEGRRGGNALLALGDIIRVLLFLVVDCVGCCFRTSSYTTLKEDLNKT